MLFLVFKVSFEQSLLPGVKYATGYRDDGVTPIKGGHLLFPPLAAGGMGTPRGLAKILAHLANKYSNKDATSLISHKTSTLMLERGEDKGALEFMGCLIGYGVFIAQAGENKILLHQAANDGFRGIALVCFDGPAASKGPVGFVILCNGDNNGTRLLAHVSRFLLQNNAFGMKDGLDWSKVDNKLFEQDDLKQEEIVNKGLKELVLDAFIMPN